MKTFLDAFKQYATTMAFGALAGSALYLLVAPGIIEWWATPEIPDAVCKCEKHVALAIGRLVRFQVYSAVAAAMVTVLGAAVFSRVVKKRAGRRAQLMGPGQPS